MRELCALSKQLDYHLIMTHTNKLIRVETTSLLYLIVSIYLFVLVFVFLFHIQELIFNLVININLRFKIQMKDFCGKSENLIKLYLKKKFTFNDR